MPDADFIEDAIRSFRYNPETGELWWRLPKQGRPRHKPAGFSVEGGRRLVTFNYVHEPVARIAFILMTGRLPRGEVDHADCNPANDRWANLREATRQQNAANRRGTARSGFKGVYRTEGRRRFTARIGVNGKIKNIGSFDTAEEAAAAYKEAAEMLYENFARS